MPRKPRLHVPGGHYHVILRGNGRQTIFFDDDDRRRWESLIAAGLRRYKHRVHAYCWMTNHVHLAIQSGEHPMCNFMRFVASQYARTTNRKYKRSGHLFERRHRAQLVQNDSYLLELIRYIHLNPVRAGLTPTPHKYLWSSHDAYIGGSGQSWLTLTLVLGIFATSLTKGRQQYARFMQSEIQDLVLNKLRQGNNYDNRILGDDDFCASFESRASASPARGTLEDLILQVCQQHDIPVSALASRSRQRIYSRIRAEIGLTAIENGLATNAEVARRFNRCQAALSRSIDRLRRKGK